MKKKFAKFLSVITAVVMALSAFSLSPFAAKTVKANNWMSAVADSTPITSINIPGTHDSATQYVTASLISRTQSLSIAEQLQICVRYLDIRLEKTGNGFNAVHGIADCKVDGSLFSENLTASKIIDYCREFLKNNPTEAVLFQIKEDDGNAGTDFYSSFYDLYVKDNPNLWFAENRIPTLGEVRGKIVLLRVVSVDSSRFDDSNSGINFSTYPYIGGQEQYDYRRCDIAELSGETYASMYVQDSYRLEGDKKWTAVKDFLDSDLNPKDFNICMTNCTGTSTPQSNATDIHGRLMNYPLEKGRYYGIITTDFTDEAMSKKIFTSNASVNLAKEPADVGTTLPPTKPAVTPTKPNSGNVTETTPETESEAVDETATAAEEAAEQTEETTKKNETEQAKKSDKTVIIICAVAGVILLGGGSALAYYLIKKRQ